MLNMNEPNENTAAGYTSVPQEVGNDGNTADTDSIELNDDHLTPVFPPPQTPAKLPEETKEAMLTPAKIKRNRK